MLRLVKDLYYSFLPIQKRFERINARNQWGSAESVSGSGSTLANTDNIRAALPSLFAELGVRKVVDVACGDFNWMSHVVAETGIDYVGFDIVPAQVEANMARYGGPNVRFEVFDITCGVPDAPADLVLFRDCMLHLSFAHGQAALRNISQMQAKWVLLSNYSNVPQNSDIPTGRHRMIDVCKAPYILPNPKRKIDENEDSKALSLWERQSLVR